MRRNHVVVILIGAVVLFAAGSMAAPLVRAGIVCSIEINDLNYPLKVEPGQGFEIDTLLTVTCNQASVAVTGRLDLYDNSTGRQLSVSGFPVGVNPNSPQWSVTASISSKIGAPAVMQILYLRMVIWVAIGEGVPALTAGRLEKSLQVEVGEATPASITTPIVVGLSTNSTPGYVLISSNSSISAGVYNSGSRLITFRASGPEGANGFTAVLLPKYFIDGIPIVLIDDGKLSPLSLTVNSNSTHYLVSFGYPLSEHTITIGGSNTIPEFDPNLLPIVVSMLTLTVLASSVIRPDRRLRI